MNKIAQAPKPSSKFQAGLQKAVSKSREAYIKQRYNTPLFVFHEVLSAFQRHNILGLSASLSFYAMFALIPLVLLMFFILSHLVLGSDYAIVKLAIITSNLMPKFSSTIMVEVYNAAHQKAAWGAIGLFVLLWAVTPLAGAMRSTFYNIASMIEAPSFIRRKIKDITAVLGMLLLFFLFTTTGLLLEKVLTFLGSESVLLQYDIVATLTSLALTTLLVAAFYYVFFPVRLFFRHIFIGALFTAILWLIMRPAFTLFLSINQSYGSVFGSMKNLFISITWLYFNFAVFLLGTELIATLRKKDVLLIRGLFNDNFQQQSPHAPRLESQFQSNYTQKLMQRYGKTYKMGDYVFDQGDASHNLYYLLKGQVQLVQQNKVIRTLEAGDYFGELALLTNMPALAHAVVTSEVADVMIIYPDSIETLLMDEPKVAMKFLRQMASQLQMQNE